MEQAEPSVPVRGRTDECLGQAPNMELSCCFVEGNTRSGFLTRPAVPKTAKAIDLHSIYHPVGLEIK